MPWEGAHCQKSWILNQSIHEKREGKNIIKTILSGKGRFNPIDPVGSFLQKKYCVNFADSINCANPIFGLLVELKVPNTWKIKHESRAQPADVYKYS